MKAFFYIKEILSHFRDKVNYLFRKDDVAFLKEKIAPPNAEHCSILSMNCFGGHIYQDFHIPYESPTAGLFFFAEDFCSLLENIDYLKRDIVILKESKWEEANKKMPFRAHPYPIGCFEGTDVEIHFLHYYTAEEAIDKWNRRIERFNFRQFLAIGFQQNGCTESTIERFNKIDIPNKVFFSNLDVNSKYVISIPEFKDKECSPDPYKYVNTYYRYLVKHLKTNPIKVNNENTV